ncbi:MAG: hypothetical protein ACLF0G_02600 [Candidatus Brocadiia bacterium]
MSFWQQNKAFVIVLGLVLIGLIFLWPSLFDLGPAVVSLHRGRYNRVQLQRRQKEPQIEEYFPESGTPVRTALQNVRARNEKLQHNSVEMHQWMSFVPRFPFRIPEHRKGNERARYVSHAYSFLRTGKLACEEYGKSVQSMDDDFIFLTQSREIPVGDPSFGLAELDRPESIRDPELRIKQLALIHDLAHLAIRLRVDEIVSITPEDRYAWTFKDQEKATAEAYPIKVHVKCDHRTLIRFLHALDGAHGSVVEVPQQAPPPVEEAAAGGREAPPVDDPGEHTAPAEAAPPAEGRRLVLKFYGRPSPFAGSRQPGDVNERVTIYRRQGSEQQLTFVANAKVTRVLEVGEEKVQRESDGDPGEDSEEAPLRPFVKVEAAVEPLSDLCFQPDGQPRHTEVRPGDFASTRFFLVRDMQLQSVEAAIEKDPDGFPEKVTPAHVDAKLSVAALVLDVEMGKVIAKKHRGKVESKYRGL